MGHERSPHRAVPREDQREAAGVVDVGRDVALALALRQAGDQRLEAHPACAPADSLTSTGRDQAALLALFGRASCGTGGMGVMLTYSSF